jgi:hypothetical protein
MKVESGLKAGGVTSTVSISATQINSFFVSLSNSGATIVRASVTDRTAAAVGNLAFVFQLKSILLRICL